MHSVERHGSGNHLGTHYRITGPVIARLRMMGGPTPRKATKHLLNSASAGACEDWTSHLLQANGTVEDLHESFIPDELKTTFLLAPRGLVITLVGDPNNVNK